MKPTTKKIDEKSIRRDFPITDIAHGWFFRIHKQPSGFFMAEGADLRGHTLHDLTSPDEENVRDACRVAAEIVNAQVAANAMGVALSFSTVAESMSQQLSTIIKSSSPANNPFAEKTPLLGLGCGAVIMWSLSIEIALKAMIQKEVGKACKTHDHEELFLSLASTTQQSATTRFEAAKAKYNAGENPPLAESLLEVLRGTNGAFETWRYVYEETAAGSKSFPIIGVELVAKALFDEFAATTDYHRTSRPVKIPPQLFS